MPVRKRSFGSITWILWSAQSAQRTHSNSVIAAGVELGGCPHDRALRNSSEYFVSRSRIRYRVPRRNLSSVSVTLRAIWVIQRLSGWGVMPVVRKNSIGALGMASCRNYGMILAC